MTNLKRLLFCFIICIVCATSNVFSQDNTKLTPSGNVVGMIITLKHPYISMCLDDGNNKLEEFDFILSVQHNNTDIKEYSQILNLMKQHNEKIKVTFKRKGDIKSKTMKTDDLRMYKLNNSIMCTGTITAIDKLGNYVALSHDIKLNDTSICIDNGIVIETEYVQEVKSKEGSVGHLLVTSNQNKIGTIKSMTEYGLQGEYINFNHDSSKDLEISKPKVGKAYVLCETPITNEIKYHEIEILEVGESSSKIRIIDKSLIEYRGGGVRGMSGSPVVQNGKIIGGVSHVYSKDATLGIIANIQSMLDGTDIIK